MIALPPGFDVSTFVSELASVCVPLISVAVLFAVATLILKALKK